MNNVLVRIYKEQHLPTDLIPLGIGKDKSNIYFFQSALGCDFFMENQIKKWWLVFFEGSKDQQIFSVEFTDLPSLAGLPENQWKRRYQEVIKNERDRAEITRLAFIYSHSPQEDTIATACASLGIRMSRAIKSSDYQHNPSHSEHIDGKGLSFITCLEGQQDQFERRILLMALGYAYLNVMEDLSNQLAEETHQITKTNYDIKKLTELYIQATEFNARFFFFLPVKHKNTSLVETWKNINKTLDIDSINKELLQKIENIHHILDWQKNQKDQIAKEQKQKIDDKFNYKIAIIGIILAFFGVLEFVLEAYSTFGGS
ncbi:hypothetical protein QJU43_02910 [Pasteurella atlantica]|uniref:hypothetical protein n=1 Tax=Pasteurellaceae TaxID=712 RepID=UPI00277995A9|nr:hypothetical protein [Pasteurella atlantica]MDP8033273.1 hypothetical protein [Pasteurella atlantica]MDP8035177.1 hypothetical protein [Pasteurella atlantica]MDP8037127.1 hypothetical protein [Pasteurella atlantica]MDP8047314.1 hypothetical protein [Pasteurella atlantica]MDP8049462.1 hypothetical protein [Pasteurella atlantica]